MLSAQSRPAPRSLPAPRRLPTVPAPRTSRPWIPSVLVSPSPPRHASLVANRPGLPLDVGDKRRMAIALQSLLDEGSKDDLKTHRKLERDRRLPRDHPSLVQDLSGENEKDCRPIFEHRHLHTPADMASLFLLNTLTFYISYTMVSVKKDIAGGGPSRALRSPSATSGTRRGEDEAGQGSR